MSVLLFELSFLKRMTVSEYNEAITMYADRLYRFVLKSIKNTCTAEDIVQDCYEKLWKNVANVDGTKVKAYLFKTAYHTIIDHFRMNKRSAYLVETNAHEMGHENNYSDLGEILTEAIGRLSEIQRIVLLLRDYEGYSYSEIGNITGLNESQVKVYIYRARVFLKNYIGKPVNVI